MSRRITLFLTLIVVVGIVSFLFIFNSSQVNVTLFWDKTITAPLALVIVSAFFLGLTVGILAIFLLGIRHHFQLRAAQREQGIMLKNEKLLASGREALAAQLYGRARDIFQQALRQRPEDSAVRVLLAECFEKEDRRNDALRILEEGRQLQSSNVEILLKAADFAESLGNDVAQFDNLSLAYRSLPESKEILRRLVAIAVRLRRFDEATTHQKQRIRLAPSAEQAALQQELASIELQSLECSITKDSAEYEKGLEDLVNTYRTFAPGLAVLAQLKHERSNIDAASKLYQLAYRHSGDVQYLFSSARMWIGAENPDMALSAVRGAIATRSSRNRQDVPGIVALSFLYLHLKMIGDFEKSLSELSRVAIPQELEVVVRYLDAKKDSISGNTTRAHEEVDAIVRGLSAEHELGKFLHLVDLCSAPATSWEQSAHQQRKDRLQPPPSLSQA